MERYIRKHLVQGREQGGYVFRRQDGVDAILNKLMNELDSNNDGLISWGGFQNQDNAFLSLQTNHLQ